MHVRACLFALALLSIGCASPEATFEVEVVNSTPHRLSVGLVKHGRSIPSSWAGPEHIAIHAPQLGERHWGTVVDPDQSIVLGPLTGSFVQGERATLRVYGADVDIDNLNAYSRTDRQRLDIDLWPGRSRYVISEKSGQLEYKLSGQ